MSARASPRVARRPQPQEEAEVRIKEETKYSFVQDIKREANRVAKGLILKEQDYNSPAVHKAGYATRCKVEHIDQSLIE